jgi:quinol monooxygenase YgiN
LTKHVKIVAILVARPGKEQALRALLDGMAPQCRAEPGNLRWDIWRDQNRPDRYVLDELYTDSAAAVAHRETPHFKNYLVHIGDLADRTSVTLGPADVAAVEP